MRIAWKRALPLVILGVGIGGFVILNATKPPKPSAVIEERSWRVAVQTLVPDRYAPLSRGLAQVTTQGELTFVAPVGAALSALPVVTGQRLKAGDLLFSLDQDEVQWTVDEAQAKVAQAQAQRVFAQASLKRLNQLQSNQLSSLNDLEQAQQTLSMAEASLKAAQSALLKTLAQQARSRVQVSQPGRVTAVLTSEGNVLSQNTPIVRFLPDEGLRLRMRVSEAQRKEMEAAVRADQLPGLSLGERNEVEWLFETFEGQASAKGSLAVFKPRRAGLPLLADLRPEAVVSVVLHLPPVSGLYHVPYAALYGREHLYLVDGDHRLQRREIHVVAQGRNAQGEWGLLIEGDVAPGDRLLTTHLPNAISGLKVDATSGL
jgi:RND family efflux transporter MFP subunit